MTDQPVTEGKQVEAKGSGPSKVNEPRYRRQLVQIRREAGEPGCVVSAFQKGGLTEKTPPELAKELACTSTMSTLDPAGERFIVGDYIDGKSFDIRLYDFRDKTYEKLFSLFPDTEGLSAVAWSDDGRYAAFVNVNQEKYKTGTTVFLLKFDANGKFVKKRKTLVPVHFECGGACYPEPLRFKGTILSYKRHSVSSDGKWTEIPLGF